MILIHLSYSNLLYHFTLLFYLVRLVTLSAGYIVTLVWQANESESINHSLVIFDKIHRIMNETSLVIIFSFRFLDYMVKGFTLTKHMHTIQNVSLIKNNNIEKENPRWSFESHSRFQTSDSFCEGAVRFVGQANQKLVQRPHSNSIGSCSCQSLDVAKQTSQCMKVYKLSKDSLAAVVLCAKHSICISEGLVGGGVFSAGLKGNWTCWCWVGVLDEEQKGVQTL